MRPVKYDATFFFKTKLVHLFEMHVEIGDILENGSMEVEGGKDININHNNDDTGGASSSTTFDPYLRHFGIIKV